MENPYKYLRQLTKTSQKDFIAKYGFAKTTITYVESGQYPEISAKLNIALGQECAEKHVAAVAELVDKYGVSTLDQAYQVWQSNERLAVAYRFQESPPERWDKEHSPFYYFIQQVAGTRQAFCKLLKVPAASVWRYEVGDTRMMPASIEAALREVRFPYLPELLAMQINWTDANT